MKFINSKYHYRLLFFGIGMGIIPAMIIGMLSYYKASQIVQDKVNIANSMIVQQTNSSIEQVLQTTDSSVIQSLDATADGKSVSDLLSSKPQHDFEVNNAFYGLSGLLNQIRSADLTNHSKLYSLEQGWEFTNSGFVFTPESADSTEQKILHENLSTLPGSFWTSDNNQLVLVKKVPFNSLNPKGIFMLEIPLYEFQKLLSANDQLGSLVIMDSTGHLIISQGNGDPSKFLSAPNLLNTLHQANSTDGNFVTAFNGNQFGVVFHKSNYSKWTYISIVNIRDITKESRSIAWYTVMIILLLMGITFTTSLVISRKMYRPILQLYQSVVNQHPAGNQRSDEIQLIKEQFNMLKSEQNYMAEQLKVQVSQLKDLFVLNLLQGEVKSGEIKDRLVQLSLPTEWEQYCVVSTQIDSFQNTRYREEDRDLLMFNITNMVGELLAPIQILPPVVMGQSQITIIHSQSGKAKFRNELYEIIERIQMTLDEYLQLKVSIGVSRFYEDLKDVHLAFQESLEVFKYRRDREEESVLFIEDIHPGGNLRIRYPEETEKELINAIKLLNKQETNTLLHRFVADVFSIKLPQEEHFMMLLRFMLELNRVAQDIGVSMYNTYRQEQLIGDLYALRTSFEVENWFKNSIIDPILQSLQNQFSLQYSSISSEVKRLIELEYDTDLTLKVCAERLNYNPNYIGQVFRKETGMTFSDYLANFRLVIAKQWLRDSDMKIVDIAERLRYTNSQNFIRYFRKMEGITPGQYRDQIYMENGI